MVESRSVRSCPSVSSVLASAGRLECPNRATRWLGRRASARWPAVDGCGRSRGHARRRSRCRGRRRPSMRARVGWEGDGTCTKVAVTGATGHVGGAVARALAERGVEQRLLVRAPERAPKLAGSVVRGCSYGDGAAAEEALAGVDTLFMVSASESADRRAQHLTFVDAAAAAGVRQIVYTSFVNAAPDAIFTLVRDHYATEQRIVGQRDGVHLPAGQLLPRLHGAVRGGAGRASPGRRTTGGSAWWPGPTWPGRRRPCCSTRSRTPESPTR